jgi:hypothetical protein
VRYLFIIIKGHSESQREAIEEFRESLHRFWGTRAA